MVNLKKIRKENNLTQEKLAEQVHCARTVIANIECGIAKPSIDTAKALGAALGFDWWEFFEEGEANGNSVYGSGSGEALKN